MKDIDQTRTNTSSNVRFTYLRNSALGEHSVASPLRRERSSGTPRRSTFRDVHFRTLDWMRLSSGHLQRTLQSKKCWIPGFAAHATSESLLPPPRALFVTLLDQAKPVEIHRRTTRAHTHQSTTQRRAPAHTAHVAMALNFRIARTRKLPQR